MNRIVIKNIPTEDYLYEEAIKTLRTNIQFSGSSLKTILITSTMPGDGKTTVSWNLAKSFSQAGKKTLYIDADLRKSVFIQRFNITKKVKGLSELLSGQVRIDDCIYGTNYENLDIVFSGPFTPNPTELFEDDICSDFFDFIKNDTDYNVIIIDSPPIGTVIDAAVLAKYANGVAVIVKSEETSRKLLLKVRTQLDKTGIRFLGIVINKVRFSKEKNYKSYYGKGNIKQQEAIQKCYG